MALKLPANLTINSQEPANQAPAHHCGLLNIRLFLPAPPLSTQKDGLKGAHGISRLHRLLGEHDQGDTEVKQPKMSLNFLSMGPWRTS